MGKVVKQQRTKKRQKQLKARRNWWANRASKSGRKWKNNGGCIDGNSLQVSQDPSTCLNVGDEAEKKSNERMLSHAKRFASSLINSMCITAFRPVNRLCACMLFICNGTFQKSYEVVRQGERKVHSAVSCSMVNGYLKIRKMAGYVGDTVFPSRPYKRKLDEITNRLERVEQELKRLKTDITNFSSHQTSSTTTSIPPLPPTVPTQALLPPPPPPPPPPVAKPPPILTFKKKQEAENDKNSINKVPSRIGISLKDLTSVKLRKVTERRHEKEQNASHSPFPFALRRRSGEKFISPRRGSKHPFVTLRDIKVTLRKTEVNTSAVKTRSPHAVHSKIAFARHNLKKVENKRSPGGTPASAKARQSLGEGLTPIMTRALQRKFKYANPPSPSQTDTFNETKSFLEKIVTQ